jgi:hypothetical protein
MSQYEYECFKRLTVQPIQLFKILFSTLQHSYLNKLIISMKPIRLEPETKIDCAGEDQQKFT